MIPRPRPQSPSLHASQRLSFGDVHIRVLVDQPEAPAGGRHEAPASGRWPCIVLLPSSLRDSTDFDELARHLAGAGHRVLRPQPRGMAGSEGPLDGISLHELAADVAHVVEALGDGRAIVAGHAFGHFVARVLDLDHPRLVRGVVVMAGAARVFPAGMPATIAVASDPSQTEAARLAALRAGFFAPGNDARAWLDGWHPSLREAYRRAGNTPDKAIWWPATNSPILELQGESDPWRPPETRDELRQVLGERVTLKLIHGASHAMVPEQPVAVAEAITAWAATLPP